MANALQIETCVIFPVIEDETLWLVEGLCRYFYPIDESKLSKKKGSKDNWSCYFTLRFGSHVQDTFRSSINKRNRKQYEKLKNSDLTIKLPPKNFGFSPQFSLLSKLIS